MSHTPAPWVWWNEDLGRPVGYDLCKLTSKTTGRCIFSCYGGSGIDALGEDEESRADARLIAAAPELLEVVRLVLRIADGDSDLQRQLALDQNSPLVDAVREAISKAECKV